MPKIGIGSMKHRFNQDILEKASMAIAWGAPDNWGTGYSASEFTSLIKEMVREIVSLRNTIKLMEEERKNEQRSI